jgi:hypothetical protein
MNANRKGLRVKVSAFFVLKILRQKILKIDCCCPLLTYRQISEKAVFIEFLVGQTRKFLVYN